MRTAIGQFIGKLALAGCLASSLYACGTPESQPGTVIVDWEIVIGCGVSGVETVEARLVDMDSSLQNSSYEAAAASCSADDPIIFAAVPPGTYEVILEGYTAEGTASYLGTAAPIRVSSGSTYEVPVIPMSQKRGAIDVKWVFGNGELCAANQVVSISLNILDETSSQLFEEELLAPFPCDPYTLEDSERIIGENPEPGSELNGVLLGDLIAGEHFVYVYGVDEEGIRVRKGMLALDVELGIVSDAKVVLVACDSEEYPEMSCE